MSSTSQFAVDTLESRRLLSGSPFEGFGGHDGGFEGDHGLYLPGLPTLPIVPTTPAPGPKTTLDLATATKDLASAQTALTKAQGDIVQLQSDQATLSTDRTTYKAAVSALLKAPTLAVTTAQAKVAGDETAEKTSESTDQAAITAVYLKDNPAIIADLKLLAADYKAGNTAQLTIDQGLLVAAKATLKTDLDATKLTLKTAHQALEATEVTDEAALQTAINTDPSVKASFTAYSGDQATYQADLLQFTTDRLSYLSARNVVQGDIAVLKTDIAGNL